jgi:hypothetical protein
MASIVASWVASPSDAVRTVMSCCDAKNTANPTTTPTAAPMNPNTPADRSGGSETQSCLRSHSRTRAAASTPHRISTCSKTEFIENTLNRGGHAQRTGRAGHRRRPTAQGGLPRWAAMSVLLHLTPAMWPWDSNGLSLTPDGLTLPAPLGARDHKLPASPISVRKSGTPRETGNAS